MKWTLWLREQPIYWRKHKMIIISTKCTHYQKLWIDFVANGCKDKALVAFFKSLKSRYSPNTLWLIYGCLNSSFIEEYGFNQKGLPRLHKYLKSETQLYVAKNQKHSPLTRSTRSWNILKTVINQKKSF